MLIWHVALAQSEGDVRVYVYGTDRFDAASLQRELGDELLAVAAAMQVQDQEQATAAFKAIEEWVEAHGPFAFKNFGVTRDPPPNPALHITIDLVEPGDESRRMPFRVLDQRSLRDFEDSGGLIAAWAEYEMKFFELMFGGELGSVPEGACPALHCLALFDHPELARYLALFDDGARQHEETLYEIVAQDREAHRRATALFLLAHTDNAEKLLPVLGESMFDPDSTVRNNAMRIMMMMAGHHPNLDYPIHALIDAMDFATSSDRNKSAYTVSMLASIPKYREIIRAEGLQTCLQLLRRGAPNNRDPAHQILRAVSGKDFPAADYAAWEAWVQAESGTAVATIGEK